VDVFISTAGAGCVEKKLGGKELAAKTRGIPVERISLSRELLVERIACASSGSDAVSFRHQGAGRLRPLQALNAEVQGRDVVAVRLDKI
jgi:hypothetical protein